MNSFDASIIHYINGFSRHSQVFDYSVLHLAHNPLLKGGVLATLMWWIWFKSGKPRPEVYEHIVSTILSCFTAIVLARGLAAVLPFRLRPMHEPALKFEIPFGVDIDILDGWSSFPSDHAVLFFTLSTGLLLLSKRTGIFAFSYSAFFICLPRIYLGLHYPTDIIAGAILGVFIGWAGNVYLKRLDTFQSGLRWLDARPAVFYPMFFLVTYQIADLFSSSRGLLRGVVKVLKILLE